MSETEDDILDEVLVGGDYQAELRRIAEGATPKRKTVPEITDDEPVDPISPQRRLDYDYEVQTPSGARLPVLTEGEVEYYEDRARRYTSDHKFSTVTDLQDLDRVLSTELMLHRYDVWLALGNDYWGQAVSERDLLRYVKDLSTSLQTLKKSMGLDKATRDKDQGADFVSWLEDVRRRAKEFGVMREEQLSVGITLFHEIKAKVQTYRNADRIEREELGLQPEAVLDWMWNDVFPRFDKVDEHFRTKSQKYWTEL
jgi:hypothetical protein